MFKDLRLILTEYRTLLFNLSVKELKIKYKSTILGFLWSVLVPVIMALVFNLIFSFFFSRTSLEGISYTAFLLTGLFPWMYFSGTISGTTNSFIDQAGVIKKVKLPIIILPISISVSNFILLLVDMVVLFGFFAILNVTFTWTLFLIPVVYLVLFFITTGLSLVISTLNVRFRDIKYIVEVGLFALFYVTPIIYPAKMVYGPMYEGRYRIIYYILKLNPLFGITTYLHDSVFFGRIIPSMTEIYSVVFGIVIFFTGVILNKAMKKKIMDLI